MRHFTAEARPRTGSPSTGEDPNSEPYLGVLPSKKVFGAERQDRPQVSGVTLPSSPLHRFSPLQLVHACRMSQGMIDHLPSRAGKASLRYIADNIASCQTSHAVITSILAAQTPDMARSLKHPCKHFAIWSQGTDSDTRLVMLTIRLHTRGRILSNI